MDGFIHVNFDVTQAQLQQTKKWLFKENEETEGDGFYSNWHHIKSSYDEGHMAVAVIDSQAVGFATWQYGYHKATINFVEVEPSNRNQGVCKLLVHTLIKKFIDQGILVCDLQCSPATSEVVWKKVGFSEYPDVPDGWVFQRGNKQLFKILVPTLESVRSESEASEVIEIWNQEPYRIRDSQQEPTWKWKLPHQSFGEVFPKPLIIPGYYKWRIRYTKDGRVVYDNQLERFSRERLYEGDFIILRGIPTDVFTKSPGTN